MSSRGIKPPQPTKKWWVGQTAVKVMTPGTFLLCDAGASGEHFQDPPEKSGSQCYCLFCPAPGLHQLLVQVLHQLMVQVLHQLMVQVLHQLMVQGHHQLMGQVHPPHLMGQALHQLMVQAPPMLTRIDLQSTTQSQKMFR